MAEHLYGVFGNAETTEEMVDASLSELRDAADSEGEAFWFIFGLTPDSPAIMGFAVQWAIDNSVAYDIVVHPTIADKVPEDFTANADKVTKIKDVEKKVVDRLIAEGGRGVLLFAGEDGDSVNSDELLKTAQRAFDEKILVLALDDANNSLDFSEDTSDVTVDGDEDIDFEALGATADGDDEEESNVAIEQLQAVGETLGISADDHSDKTWTEFAEVLAEEAREAEERKGAKPAKAAAKTSKSTSKAASSTKANTWTEEALTALAPKELKEIAKAAGVENFGKKGVAALIKDLLGKPTGEAAEPEPEPTKPARTRAAKKTAEPVEDGDMSGGELVGLVKELIDALQGFVDLHS